MDPLQQELINNLIITSFENVLLPHLNKLHELAKDEITKFKIDWNKSFKKYLSHSYEKYSRIKTLIFKTEPKFIYDFFEPPLLSINERKITTENVATLLQEFRFLIIKGEGGMGKSTLLKHLFINTIKKTEQIPVFLELLYFNDATRSIDIFNLLNEKLSRLGCDLDKDLLEYALTSGCFVFFLDGYDELIPDRRDTFFNELDGFCDKYSKNYYVMTSRPYSDFIEFQRFTSLTCERLTKEQAISLIAKINLYDERIKEKFISELDENLYDSHYHFASNPLLLNIMFLTYDNYAEVPAKRHIFYEYAYETMYQRHDATKGTFKRNFKSDLSSDRFKKILAAFCFITYANGKIEMSKEEVLSQLSKTHARCGEFDEKAFLDDLTNAVCILYKEGLDYKFIHRSFQEYFVALFLIELPDEDLSSIVNKFIQSSTHSFLYDDVLPMLADMTSERFERSILIPYLRRIEEGFDEGVSKYDQYFRILCHSIRFHFRLEEENDLLIQTEDRFLARIARMYDKEYYDPEDYSELEKYLEPIQLERLDKPQYDEVFVYSGSELFESSLFEALKTTWIGIRVRMLSDLLMKLENKNREQSFLSFDLPEVYISKEL